MRIRILLFIVLSLLLSSLSWAERPAEPSIDSLNNSIEDEVYFRTTSVKLKGSSQLNTRVNIYVDGSLREVADCITGSWNATISLGQKSSFYTVTARAFFNNDPEMELSYSSLSKKAFIDYTAPTCYSYNRSRWQGNSYYVRNELLELYGSVADSGGCGFGETPTINGDLYDITAGVSINGTVVFNGSNKINFIPSAGYSSGTFTNKHVYRLYFSIMDRAGNFRSGTREFIIDYTTPAYFDRSKDGDGVYNNIYLYDPAHKPNASVGEPADNYPIELAESQAITGDDRLVGFVRFYENMDCYTNPTRFYLKWNVAGNTEPGVNPSTGTSIPSDGKDWGSSSSLKAYRYGEYIDGWNNWGGWYYLQSDLNNSYHPTNNVNIGRVDKDNGFMITRSFARPQGVWVDNWFYIRDAAYNRYTYHIHFFSKTGPPKAPDIDPNTQYKNNSSKIPADKFGGATIRRIQTIRGNVKESGESQTASLYVNSPPSLSSNFDPNSSNLVGWASKAKTNFIGADLSYEIANTKNVYYNENGVTRLYLNAYNSKWKYGPYTYWDAAFCDNTDPVITSAYVYNGGGKTYYSKDTVPSMIQVNVNEQPYLSWYDAFKLKTDTASSYFDLVNNSGTNYSSALTNVWYRSAYYYSGRLDISTIKDSIKNLEQAYYADIKVEDNYDLTATDKKWVFSIDNTAPAETENDYKILPESGGTVNALSKFSVVFSDPPLSLDNSSGSGISFGSGAAHIGDPKYSQLFVYKILTYQKPDNANQFTITLPNGYTDEIDDPDGNYPVQDHAGNNLPTGNILIVWDSSNNLVQEKVCLSANESKNIIVTTNVALNTSAKYYVLYPIPFYYSSNRINTLASIPYESVKTIGQYKVAFSAVDQVYNKRDILVDYQIKFDPPTGAFALNRIAGLASVTANRSDYSWFEAGPIFTKTGRVVKEGTLVSLQTDLGEFTDGTNIFPDEDEFMPGIQIKTDANGKLQFGLRSLDIGVASIYVKTEAGTAVSNTEQLTFHPDLISDILIALPGQTFNTENATIEGSPMTLTAGATFNVRLYCIDAYNHLVTDIADRISFASGDNDARIDGTDQNYVVKSNNNNGVYSFDVWEKIAGSRTISVVDSDRSSVQSNRTFTIVPDVPDRLLTLVGDQEVDPKSADGRTAVGENYDVNEIFNVSVKVTDRFYNLVPGVTVNVQITGLDAFTVLNPAQQVVSDSVNVFEITEYVPGIEKYIHAEDIDGILVSSNSSYYQINSAPATQLQLLIPNENSAPAVGKQGTVIEQVAGVPFVVTVNAVDDFYNIDGKATHNIILETLDNANTVISNPTVTLVAGIATFSVTEFMATANLNLRVRINGDLFLFEDRSATYNVTHNVPSKLLIVMPGQDLEFGSDQGVLGDANPQVKNIPFVIDVYAVDEFNNLVEVNENVYFLGINPAQTDVIPLNKNLTNGYVTFSIKEKNPIVNQTLTVTSNALSGMKGAPYEVVNSGEPVALLVEMPGQSFVELSPISGQPTDRTAGVPFIVTVNIVDSFNLICTDNNLIRLIGPATYNPTYRDPYESGVVTFSVTMYSAGGSYVKAKSDTLQGMRTYTVVPNTPNQVAVVLPGQSIVSGKDGGVKDDVIRQVSGGSFNADIYIVDAYFNFTTPDVTVTFNASDEYAVYSSSVAISNGNGQSSFVFNKADSNSLLYSRSAGLNESVASFNVIPGAIYGMQVLLPGQISIPGSPFGVSRSVSELFVSDNFVVTVSAVDYRNNVKTDYDKAVRLTGDNFFVSIDEGTKQLVNGQVAFSVRETIAKVSTLNAKCHIYDTNASYEISPGTPAKLQILMPGESNYPGMSAGFGKIGNKETQKVGVSFNIDVLVVDNYFNLVSETLPFSVSLFSSKKYGFVDMDKKPISSGMASFEVTEKVADMVSYTVTTDITYIVTESITIEPSEANGVLLLVPGEVHEPGYITANADMNGKLGTPISQVAGAPFCVTVNLVDQYYNVVKEDHLIKINSTDSSAPIASNRMQSEGVVTFSVVEYKMTPPTKNRRLVAIDITSMAGETTYGDEGLPGFQVMNADPAIIVATSDMDVTANLLATGDIEISVYDLYYNPVASQSVSLYTTRVQDVISVIDPTTNVSGKSFFEIKSSRAGMANVNIESFDASTNITLQGSLSVSFIGDASNPSVTLSSLAKSADTAIASSNEFVFITAVCKDVFDNPIPNKQMSISSSRGLLDNIAVLNDITDYDGRAFFRLSSTEMGTTVVSLRDETDTLDMNATLNVSFVADKDHPSTSDSKIVLYPTRVAKVGRDLTARVTLFDNYGNLITGNTVSVYTSRPSDDVITTINSITGDLPGVDYAEFMINSTKAGNGYVYGMDINSGYVISSELTHQYRYLVEDPDMFASIVTLNPDVLAADMEATASIKVFINDKYFNPIPDEDVFVYSSRGVTDSITTINATTDSEGIAYFSIKSAVLGESIIVGGLQSGPVIITPDILTFVPGAVNTANTIVTVSTSNVIVGDYVSFNILLRDKMNNPLSSVTINVSSSRGDVDVVSPIPIMTDVNGFAEFYVRSNAAGISHITVTDSSSEVVITKDIELNYTIDKSKVSHEYSTVSISPNTIVADNVDYCRVEVVLRDIYYNAIEGNEVTLRFDGVTVDVFSVTANTNIEGIATFDVKGTIAGDVIVGAIDVSNSVNITETKTITLIPDKDHISPTYSSVEIVSSIPMQPYVETYATGTDYAKIKVILRDYYGNKVNDKKVSANTSRSSSDNIKVLNSSNITGYDNENDGQSMFFISSTVLGKSAVSVMDIDTGVWINQQATINFVADRYDTSPEKSSITINPVVVTANGEDSAQITLYIRDRFSNLISGNVISLKSSRKNRDNIIPLYATTNAQGLVTFSVRSQVYGVSKLTVRDETAYKDLFINQEVEFVAEPIPSTINSDLSIDSDELQVLSVGEKNQATIKIAVKDRFSNPIIGDEIYLESSRVDDILTPTVAVSDVFGRTSYTLQSRYAGESEITAYHVPSGVAFGTLNVTFLNPLTISNMQLMNSPGSVVSSFEIGEDSLYVQVSDSDNNMDSFTADTLNITVTNPGFGDTEFITLIESGVNTGIFNNYSAAVSINYSDTVPIPTNNIIEARYNDNVVVRYVDPSNPGDVQQITAPLTSKSMTSINEGVAYMAQNGNEAVFRYTYSGGSDIQIWIYDMTGQMVHRMSYSLGFPGALSNMENTVYWNLVDSYGNNVNNGLYIYRIFKSNSTNYELLYTGKLLVVR